MPTLVVSLSRWRSARGDWSLRAGNSRLLVWMGAGSIAGAGLGARLLGWVDGRMPSLLLAALLVCSAAHLGQQAQRQTR